MSMAIDSKERSGSLSAERKERLEDLRLYSLTELESILGVTHRTLLTYVKDGRLKAVKLGGKWKVSEDTVRQFVRGDA